MIVNPYRATASHLNASLGSELVGEQSIYDQLRVSEPLTPAVVSRILKAAHMGRPKEYVDLVYAIRRRDGTIHDCYQTRELGVQTLKLAVVVPPSIKKTVNKRRFEACQKIADELHESLSQSQNFHQLRAGTTGEGLAFGRSLWEIVWKVTKKNRLWFDHFKMVHPRRFIFRQSDSKLLFDPNGLEIDAHGIDLKAKYPNKFVGYFPRVNGDSLLREGMGELTVWLGMFRNWATRDYLQTAEAAWKPRRRGTYEKDASGPDKIGLVQAMRQLSQTGGCVIPATCKIDELWSLSTTKGEHQMLLTWLGREFAKGTLGSFDSIEASDTGSSKIDANNRAILRFELRESDAIGQSVELTNDLAVPFTTLNYGPNADVPLVLLLTDDVKDLNLFAQVIETLQRTGLPIGQNYVYDKAGIEIPDPDEKVLVSPMWTNEGAGGTAGGQNGSGDQKKPKPSKPKPSKPKKD